jgi:repressor LexA
MPTDELIGKRIQEIRTQRGMTQEALAERINISKSSISEWEACKRVPRMETLRKIADALGVDVWEIIGFNDVEFTPVKDGVPLPSNVRPISALHHQRVPLIGSVAAGEPIYDPEELGVYVDSPVDADAAITIRGDSMIPTYQDGDMVYIKCRPEVPEGAVAVVFLDNEATLKHVYFRKTGLTLISDNPSHPPIMAEFEDYDGNVRIFGVPVGYTRIYKSDPLKKIKKGF